jgi:hypothetical protein
MSTIDENGFLHGAISEWVEATRTVHKDTFETAESINRLCHEFLSDRKIDLSETKTFVLSLIFARMLELYQANILLNARGMTGAGSVVFRSHIEAHFHFDAILKNDAYLDQYIDNFHIQRRHVAKSLASSKDEGLEELRSLFTEEKLKELDELMRNSFAKKLSIRKVAELGGNAGTYHVAYSFLSNDTHVNSWALEKYLDKDTAATASIRYGPVDTEVVRQLGLIGIVMLEAYEKLAGLLNEEVDARKGELAIRVKRLLDGNGSNQQLQRTGEDAGR